MTILYAWVVPAWFDADILDHTWVTTYDNRKTPYGDPSQVIAHREHYWFSWGDFHPKGKGGSGGAGDIGSAYGLLGESTCIALPDVETKKDKRAQGTIYRYGVDGVCHQLSNQILSTTGIHAGPPLTVSKARGYFLSNLIYGAYGVDSAAWNAKVKLCQGTGASMPKLPTPPDDDDEFSLRARRILGDDVATFLALMDLRRAALLEGIRADRGAPVSAEELNARNQRFFDRAAKILGPQRFLAMFGVEAGREIRLVDPTLGEGRPR